MTGAFWTALFTAVFNWLRGWASDRQAAETREDKGRSDKAAEINKDSADAQHRANQVLVDAPDVGDRLDAMERDGKF